MPSVGPQSPAAGDEILAGDEVAWTNFDGVIGTGNGYAVNTAPQLGDCQDLLVSLTFNASTPSGSNKASGSTWPYSSATASYGGAADLWATSPALGDIKGNANFGLLIQVQQVNPAGSTSNYLLAYTFDFSSIPSGATIVGIAASFDRYQTGGDFYAEVQNVLLTVYYSTGITGTASITQAANTISSAGSVSVNGTASIPQGANTISAAGEVITPPSSGSSEDLLLMGVG